MSQNSDLIPKLDPTRPHKSRGILGFQNRVRDIKLLKIHADRDNRTYLEKHDFQQKLIFQIWDHYWICGVKPSLRVVSVPNSKSRLALHAKWGKVKLLFFIVSLKKRDFLTNGTKYKHIIYHWKAFLATSMDSRVLPQNKALVGSDQLSKFHHFARKSMSTIQALLLWTEGSIVTRGWKELVGIKNRRTTICCCKSVAFPRSDTRLHHRVLAATKPTLEWSTSLKLKRRRVLLFGRRRSLIARGHGLDDEEKDRTIYREKEQRSEGERVRNDRKGRWAMMGRERRSSESFTGKCRMRDEGNERRWGRERREWVETHVEVPYWGPLIFFFPK